MKRVRIEYDGGNLYHASIHNDDIVVRVEGEMVYPRTSGWIKLSERRPIEADADENGFVLARFSDSKEPSFRTWFALKHWQRAVAFMPIPKFTEEQDKDTEAFDKVAEYYDDNEVLYDKRLKRKYFWDAALRYERGEK